MANDDYENDYDYASDNDIYGGFDIEFGEEEMY